MGKIRVCKLSKELDVSNDDIITALAEMGIEVTSAQSGIEEEQADALRKSFAKGAAKKAVKPKEEKKADEADTKKAVKAEKTEKAEKAEKAPKSEKVAKAEETPKEQKTEKASDKTAKAAEEKAVSEKPLKDGEEKAQSTGAAPKKKKKIIVVSNLHNSQGQSKGSAAPSRDARPAAGQRGDQRSVSGRPSQGIIKPTVPTTAAREARLAEQNGGDNNKLRKSTGQVPKINKEEDKAVLNSVGTVADNNDSDTRSAESKEAAVVATPTETAAVKENVVEKVVKNPETRNNQAPKAARDGQNNRPFNNRDSRPERSDRQERSDRPQRDNRLEKGDRAPRDGQGKPGQRGGVVINRGKNFGAADAMPTGKEGEKNRNDKDSRRRQEKDKREKNFDNEDGFRGGKPVKGAKVAKLERPTEKKQAVEEEKIKVITLPEVITIKDLADKMKVQASAIIKKLFLQGQIVTVNQEISYEQAEEIAVEYEILCEKEVVVDVIEELLKEDEEDENTMTKRPPVVCVMGHVDHGKTSLLDAIRKTKVIANEAGGITQHIGAYVVNVKGQNITFLDTPGHEAFTAMRMRGANATDVAILVVAADDGVMPQTVEAINHAKAAGIEIIVAVNKIDKPSANIDRVKQELSEYELVPEDWGGSTVFAPVSAKTGEGIESLLEMIILTSEILELKANAKRKARGLVIEAQLDKGRGPVATILVQKGTLKVGDFIAAGSCHGKVRAMIDDNGRRIKEAGPSTPVEILGLNDVPGAGEIFVALDSDKEAKNFAETFISQNRAKLLDDTKSKMSLENLFSQIQAANLKELNLIIKADVQGSVEAVKESLLKLSNEEVVVKVIHSGVGAINESDVILASASNAIIIGFNIRPDATAKNTAESEGVDIRLYDVIYKAIEDVEAAMKGMLDPIFEEKIIGHAEVRQIFKASSIGNIAGSYVTDGIMQRGALVRITREGEQVYEGKLASLKRFKDDAKEVKQGFECGLVFDDFNDVAEADIVEAYVMVEVPRT